MTKENPCYGIHCSQNHYERLKKPLEKRVMQGAALMTRFSRRVHIKTLTCSRKHVNSSYLCAMDAGTTTLRATNFVKISRTDRRNGISIFPIRLPDSIQLQVTAKRWSKFDGGALSILSVWARMEAGTGISWIMMMLASVQIPVMWYPCTDLAVFQKWAIGASPEGDFSDGPDRC
jgi:hypothetical protein